MFTRQRAAVFTVVFLFSTSSVMYSQEHNVLKPLLSITKATRSAEQIKIGDNTVQLSKRDYAQLTIDNGLTEAIDLRYTVGPEQHFTPVVRRKTGEVVSSGHNFGVTVSLLYPERTLTIMPGQSHRIDLWYPFETVPTEKNEAEEYYFRVQFHHKGKVWESNEIEINYK
jgi:hypothetical protein